VLAVFFVVFSPNVTVSAQPTFNGGHVTASSDRSTDGGPYLPWEFMEFTVDPLSSAGSSSGALDSSASSGYLSCDVTRLSGPDRWTANLFLFCDSHVVTNPFDLYGHASLDTSISLERWYSYRVLPGLDPEVPATVSGIPWLPDGANSHGVLPPGNYSVSVQAHGEQTVVDAQIRFFPMYLLPGQAPVSLCSPGSEVHISAGLAGVSPPYAADCAVTSYRWQWSAPGQGPAVWAYLSDGPLSIGGVSMGTVSGSHARTLQVQSPATGWPHNGSLFSFRCEIQTSCGFGGMSGVRSYSYGAPLFTGAHPTPLMFAPGATITLVASATPESGASSYHWARNGVPIANGPAGASSGGGTVAGASGSVSTEDSTTATLTISNAQASDAGQYTLVLSNSCGTVSSEAAAASSYPCDIIDYNDARFASGPAPTGGTAVAGLCADGVTRVLLRLQLPGGAVDPVTFALRDELDSSDVGEAGSLYDPVADPGAVWRATTLGVNPVQGDQGPVAYAVLTAPIDYVRYGVAGDLYRDDATNPRMLSVNVYPGPPGSSTNALSATNVRLHRPPVVLLHGLNSSDREEFKWYLKSDTRVPIVYLGDYSGTHTDRLSVNRFAPLNSIQQALRLTRAKSIAATQVDFFGHSMGGLLGRKWAGDPLYRRPENFQQGDFHKLVTVNTPHRGSALANIAVTHGNLPTFTGAAADFLVRSLTLAFNNDPFCLTCGGVADLRPDSDAIQTINATPMAPVPAHAMFGTGGSTAANTDAVVALMRGLAIACGGGSLDSYLGGVNDAIVSVDSQKGGLEENCPTCVYGIDGALGVHTNVCKSAGGEAYNHAIDLLNAPVVPRAADEPRYFAIGFPTYVGAPFQPPPCWLLNSLVVRSTTIAATANPAWAAAGGLLAVAMHPPAQPDPEFTPSYVEFVFYSRSLDEPMDYKRVTTPPYEVTFDVPADVIGDVAVYVRAVDSINLAYEEVEMTVPSLFSATLDSMHATPELHLSSLSRQARLEVTGHYSDGQTRSLDSGTLGTSFTSSDSTVASVDTEGRVTAFKVGSTTIAINNGGLSAQTLILVDSVQGDWDGNGTIDRSDAVQFMQAYTGPSGSAGYQMPPAAVAFLFDFDGDNDIDCIDWLAFDQVWSGAGVRPRLLPCECPSDLDNGTGTGASDGGTDINDLLYFLTSFEAGITTAVDLDDGSGSGMPDGGVDVNDLLFFLAHFETGC
jgi:Immunoglobulin domain